MPTRPFKSECVDALRLFESLDEEKGVGLPDNEGVTRPLCVDVTEEGRRTAPWLVLGAESLFAKIKMPQLGGHLKYCFLLQTH